MAAPGPATRAGPPPASASGRPTTVLVVDDSPIVRRLVTLALDGHGGHQVVGEAPDGRSGLAQVAAIRPDVLILDLEMPVLDGQRMLEELQTRGLAIRVVVFANVEPADRARVAAQVEAAGATLVVKPVGVADVDQAVLEVRRALLGALAGLDRAAAAAPAARPPTKAPRVVNAVVIAASTGGPHALETVLGSLCPLRVPIFIVQHISGDFSGRLAEQLDHACPFPVMEAEDGQHPEPGSAYLSPGGIHLTVERGDRGTVMRLRDLPPVNSCRPSADVLFLSSADIYGPNQLAVVLTGIGQDGLEGTRHLGGLGAPVLVQDEASSVVWGMPGSVAGAGLADEILPLGDVAGRIERLATLSPSSAERRP